MTDVVCSSTSWSSIQMKRKNMKCELCGQRYIENINSDSLCKECYCKVNDLYPDELKDTQIRKKKPFITITLGIIWVIIYFIGALNVHGVTGEAAIYGEFYFFSMISFPSNYLVGIIWSIFYPASGNSSSDSIPLGVIAVNGVIGFIQWFIILPYIIRIIRTPIQK